MFEHVIAIAQFLACQTAPGRSKSKDWWQVQSHFLWNPRQTFPAEGWQLIYLCVGSQYQSWAAGSAKKWSLETWNVDLDLHIDIIVDIIVCGIFLVVLLRSDSLRSCAPLPHPMNSIRVVHSLHQSSPGSEQEWIWPAGVRSHEFLGSGFSMFQPFRG